MTTQFRQKGFSIIELIVYLAVLSAISILAVGTLLSLSQSYISVIVSRNIHSAAAASLELMGREIRASSNIHASSTLGLHPGLLSLDRSGTTTEFFLASTTLRVRENGDDIGALTNEDAEVTNLVFYQLDNGTSKGIRIELEITSSARGFTRVERFYDFIVLRRSY